MVQAVTGALRENIQRSMRSFHFIECFKLNDCSSHERESFSIRCQAHEAVSRRFL
jgi:hypothetical protein